MNSKIIIIGFSNPACRIAAHLAETGAKVSFAIDESNLNSLPPMPHSVFLLPCVSIRPETTGELASASDAAIIATDNEQFNIHVALHLAAVRPGLRIVLRLFNLALGREMEGRLPNVSVMSVSDIAAPYFAAASLEDNVKSARRDDKRLLVSTGGSEEPLDCAGIPACDCGCSDVSCFRMPEMDRMLVLVLFSIASIVSIATMFFSLRHNIRLGDALYFVVTTITTTGYGDFSLREYPFSTKLAGMALMLSGAALFAILFAIITDKLFRFRIELMMGRRQVKKHGHIVVCGAGDVGIRVVESLLLAGVEVVVVEQNQEGRFMQRLRDMGIPLIIADATLEDSLSKAGVRNARSIICATDNDMRNLETALNARAMNPSLRIVLRIYDREFAERIEASFGINAAFSSSAIAAPVFAEAAATTSQSLPLPVPLPCSSA